jgi:hypothetical protein
MHTITTHFCSTICIMQLERIHNLLKLLLHMIILQPFSRCWYFTWEVTKDLPYFPDFGPCDYNLFPNWKPLHGELFAERERVFWQQFGTRWNRLACQVYSLPYSSLTKSCRQPKGLFWTLWTVCISTVFVIFSGPYSFCVLQQNIKTTIQKCVVCLPPNSGSSI